MVEEEDDVDLKLFIFIKPKKFINLGRKGTQPMYSPFLNISKTSNIPS